MKNWRTDLCLLSQNLKDEVSPYFSTCKNYYFVPLGEKLSDSLIQYF